MRSSGICLLCLLLPPSLAAQAGNTGQPSDIVIRTLQGEGTIHAVGARSGAVLTIEVTDQAGIPVPGAVVSFLMPADGPRGTFSNGFTADVVITGDDGRASIKGVQWNKNPGPFAIRVTAAKGGARASASVPMELAGRGDSRVPRDTARAGRSRTKILLLVAGAAAGSVAAGLLVAKKSNPASPSGASLSLGAPTITVGGPQ